jgi:hypothetical protein
MVDEYNRPLYGDPFGVLGDQDGLVSVLKLSEAVRISQLYRFL